MAQVIEVPGMGNVEFPDEMSEAEISQAIDTQLAEQKKQSEGPITPEDMVVGAGAVAPRVLPAIARTAAATPGAVSGAYNAGKAVVGPTLSGGFQAGKDVLGTYIKNPGAAAADIAASHLGLPPPVASTKAQPLYEGINKSYQAVQDYLKQMQPKPQPVQGTIVNPSYSNSPYGDVKYSVNGVPLDQVQKAGQLSNQMTNQQLLEHIQSGQTQEELANKLAQQQTQQKVQQIATTQGPAAVEGSSFVQTLSKKFAPMAEAVSPYISKAAPYAEAAMKGFNKVALPAAIAHELFYTSPEEIAILKKAEAEKRAKGWKPINER